ncbi:hypothetical protein [Roseibium sp. MMSF_3412]|uniref:hypothetical protein n=1 Tax=Roseibium sp. MMSF_3412 TaxID=3046712 RepID=UPI00273FC1CB|nr:hypothetical protein [Roseibium sp. MMSF_3412]
MGEHSRRPMMKAGPNRTAQNKVSTYMNNARVARDRLKNMNAEINKAQIAQEVAIQAIVSAATMGVANTVMSTATLTESWLLRSLYTEAGGEAARHFAGFVVRACSGIAFGLTKAMIADAQAGHKTTVGEVAFRVFVIAGFAFVGRPGDKVKTTVARLAGKNWELPKVGLNFQTGVQTYGLTSAGLKQILKEPDMKFLLDAIKANKLAYEKKVHIVCDQEADKFIDAVLEQENAFYDAVLKEASKYDGYQDLPWLVRHTPRAGQMEAAVLEKTHATIDLVVNEAMAEYWRRARVSLNILEVSEAEALDLAKGV